MLLRRWTLFLLLVISCNALATVPMHFSELRDAKGHSILNVRSLFADEQGFLWFGGDAGIYRFDGYEALQLNAQPTRAIYVDNNDRLWSAGTTTLSLITPGTFENVYYRHLSNRGQKPSQEIIYDMLDTRAGRLLVATKEGLSEYHQDNDNFTHFTLNFGRQQLSATALAQSSDGDILLGTNAGLFRLKEQQLEHQTQLPEPLIAGPAISEMVELIDGSILVGSNNGVYWLSDGIKHFASNESDNSLSHNNVTALLVDNEQRVWVGTSNGLNVLTLEDAQIQRYYQQKGKAGSIANNYITDLFQDRQHNIYIATYAGINRYNQNDIHLQSAEPSSYGDQAINNVWSIAEQADGSRWVGTFGSGLFHYDGERVASYNTDVSKSNSLLHNRVSALKFDRQQQLWIGTTKGLQRFNVADRQFHTIADLNTGIFDIAFGAFGLVWLAADDGVYQYSRKSGEVKRFGQEGQLKVAYKQWVRSVLSVDNLLLAGADEGLSVLNLSDNRTEIFPEAGAVIKLTKDSADNIWVLALQGLSIYDPIEGKLKQTLNLVSPGDVNGCNGMAEDAFKQLWLVCNNSLKVLDIHSKQLLASYSVEQGIDLSGFLTGAQSFVQTSQGEIHVALRQGIVKFKPKALRQKPKANKVALTKISQSDKNGQFSQMDNPYSLAVKPHKPYSATLQKIVFEFSALSMEAPGAIRYRYRLRGLEQNFSTTDADNRRAVYTNLPGGRYQFEVEAIYPDMSTTSNTFEFAVAVSPWLSWWAIVGYVLTCLLLGYLALRLRTHTLVRRGEQLEKQVQMRTEQLQHSKHEIERLMNEREKLIENVYHQTRTPLQIMLGNIDGLSEGTLNIADYAQKQSENIHALVDLTDRILEVTKAQTHGASVSAGRNDTQCDLSALLTPLCLSMTDVAKAKGLSFDCAIDNALMVWAEQQALQSIFENILSNAIKYTDSGGIRVSAQRHGDRLLFRCCDSGIGIPAAALESIFERYQRAENALDRQGNGIGLAMVKTLVDALDGEVNIHSESGKGTEVEVWLPAIVNHGESGGHMVQTIEQPQTSATDRPCILVVEDNIALAAYINKLLSGDYQVMMAGNGKDGCEQARQMVPDLVLSDVMMPQMDGYELCSQLRSDEITCHIPILLITAKNDAISREKGYAVGANDFINKPFKATELLHRVSNQLALVAAIKAKAAEPQTNEWHQGQNGDRLIERFLAFIEANYHDSEIQIKAVCQALYVSNRQLERKVKHFLNMTPNALLNEYRLARACELISQGKKPTEVYELCGFASHAYFSKRFKERYNLTPSQYKNDSKISA